ncbi:MAG: periplasmic heavy metal sensor [Nitrospirae bacterium]|nr:periplasmic heavy metal sensor [Nitrospirota bacterium]MDA1304787.1 periplasmic heavy metal sensor [Nitrospirota bacterium]
MDQRRQVFGEQSRVVNFRASFIWGLTLAFCSLVLVSSGWAGEDGHRHDHNPEKHLAKMTERLGLTESQQAKIKPLLEQKAQQLEALHQQMKDVRQNTRTQLESELTPDQLKIFKEFQEERKERMKSHKDKHDEGYKGKHKKGGHDKHKDGSHHDD